MRFVRAGLLALCAALAAVVMAAPSAVAQQFAPAASGLPEPSSPDLIDRAQEDGTIDNETANLYRVYALKGDSRLPAAYESDTPFDGTVELLKARRELRLMEHGSERQRVVTALRAPPPDPNVTNCDVLSATPLPDSTESDHFYIQYNAVTLHPSLSIEDYEDSLDRAWETEVGVFGWAAPPLFTSNPAPDGLYHVRIDALAPVLYGFVSSQGTYAGPVGDNPNSSWNDADADATCMGLNQDYTPFPGTPRQALDATTAHEFNHSLQFGYGGLNGANVPDDNFIEGGATWMEDEVQDGADDNYNYLYPDFDDSMGEYEGDIYAYWLTWRGLTERFGTGTASGGEQVMQDFWELTSKNLGDNLTAMQQALATQGTTLPDAYHDYAIAAKMMRACGGSYFLPYCFEEADGYRNATGGEPTSHGSINSPGSFSNGIEDNYTLNWVDLPITGGYNLTLTNNGPVGTGTLRGTVACDTGSAVALETFPLKVGGTESTQISGFDPDTCERAVAVITNETQTAANPAASTTRPYTLTAASAPPTNPPEVTTDTLPPDTRITSGPSAFTNSTTVSFEFVSSKVGSSFDCVFDSVSTSGCTSPFTRAPLAEGTYSFAVGATGSGGTDPTPDTRSFTVDTTPPDTQISAGPTGTIRSSSATFEFAASEAPSRLECRLDAGTFARCSSPTTRSGLADGRHTFEARARDRAENNDPSPASRTFVVDTKPISVPDTTRPVLTGVRLSSRRFRASRSGAAITAAPLGTRVRYRLSEAATVRLRYERRLTGRRVGGRCRAVSLRNRGRERCLRNVLVRGLARRRGGTAGANSFRLTGRMNGRALRPGVYRLRLSARDGSGNASSTRRSGSFRIVRR